MDHVLVTGGTDGVGRAVALDALAGGAEVIAVGSSQAKGDALLADAERAGAGDRAVFLRADLRLVSENSRVLDAVRERWDRLDRLVLSAQRYETRVERTTEGVERNFALTYLSRFLLAYGLLPELHRAERPLVVNVCGTGTAAGRISWDDPQFTRTRGGFRALMQGARATDLLGVEFARRPDTADVPFVLFNPDFVRTNLQRELPQPFKLVALVALALRGKPVEVGVVPLLELLAQPPEERLLAFRGPQPVDMGSRKYAKGYDPADAARLFALTRDLLDGLDRSDLLPA